MSKNKTLQRQQEKPNDEYYTRYEDVQYELDHYHKYLKNKRIYCNCDDPAYSAFWAYFHKNFSAIGIKSLTATYYINGGRSIKTVYCGGSDEDISSGSVTPLEGDGDFRSEECQRIIDENDVIITNPPFSLFREFTKMVMQHDKKFIVWGTCLAVTYSDIFTFIASGIIRPGYIYGTCYFITPQRPESDANRRITNKIGDGKYYAAIKNTATYTNINIPYHPEPLELTEVYDESKYKKIDGIYAIYIDRVNKIPSDYKGIMAVPVTFMKYYDPEKYMILRWENAGNGKYVALINAGDRWVNAANGEPFDGPVPERQNSAPDIYCDGKKKFIKLLIMRRH